MKPDSIFCYAKLGIKPLDSATLIVIFKKNGQSISSNIYKISEYNPTVWKKFGFKLSPFSVVPDSVIVGFSSGNIFTNQGIQDGSFVILDDLHFNTSQTIDNGGFENWTNVSMEYTTDFFNANIRYVLKGAEPPVAKTNDAYQGTYACKVKTVKSPSHRLFTGFYNGYWNDAKIDFTTIGDTTLIDFTGGFAYNLRVDTLIGWYKLIPSSSSTTPGRVNISFQTADTTFAVLGVELPAVSNYTMFRLPFNLALNPDPAIITIYSSESGATIADTGSVLFIDNLQFKSDLLRSNIYEPKADKDVVIVPNPTTGVFDFIYSGLCIGSETFNIGTIDGRVLQSGKIFDVITAVDVCSYERGIYLLHIFTGNSVITKKICLIKI